MIENVEGKRNEGGKILLFVDEAEDEDDWTAIAGGVMINEGAVFEETTVIGDPLLCCRAYISICARNHC